MMTFPSYIFAPPPPPPPPPPIPPSPPPHSSLTLGLINTHIGGPLCMFQYK